MDKHTPGPWEVDSHRDVLSANGRVVAVTPAYKAATAIEKARNNARLIAAAPDLLRELEKVLGWLVVYDDLVSYHGIDEARAAIAKATGENDGNQT